MAKHFSIAFWEFFLFSSIQNLESSEKIYWKIILAMYTLQVPPELIKRFLFSIFNIPIPLKMYWHWFSLLHLFESLLKDYYNFLCYSVDNAPKLSSFFLTFLIEFYVKRFNYRPMLLNDISILFWTLTIFSFYFNILSWMRL